jgi:hypothetical protein
LWDFAEEPDEDLGGVQLTVTTSGTVPPGMTVAPPLRYFGTPTAAGTYRFAIVYRLTEPESGYSFSATLIARTSSWRHGPAVHRAIRPDKP